MTRARARSYAAALLAAAVVGAATGCSDDPAPRPKVAPSSSAASSVEPTPTPEPTPTGPVEPTLPPEAQGEDAAAAEAFVRHYWEMTDYAQSTGDVAGLRRLATDGCTACQAVADSIRDVYRDGGSLEGGGTSLSTFRTVKLRLGSQAGYQVRARVRNAEQTLHYGDGREDRVFPPDTVEASLVVVAADEGFRVTLLEVA